MSNGDILNKYGAIHIKDVISKEMCHYFTRVMMRCGDLKRMNNQYTGDEQIPNCRAILDHEYMFETYQEMLWPSLENLLGEELLPTYSYARLYTNGDELKIHSDRDACEISVTIQLGRSHHYSWPIYMGGRPYYMAEGDGVVYRGCDIDHWREPCNGPEGYYSGQAFIHFVRKNGTRSKEAGDSNARGPEFIKTFNKARTFLMEEK
jgi:hypothetical protein